MTNSLANIPTLDAVNPGAVANAASGINRAGSGIQSAGADVAAAWSKLPGVYRAPEAGELIGAIKPVQQQAQDFGRQVGQVGAALSDYAAEIAPVKAKLAALKAAAGAMLLEQAATPGGESHWRRKQSNVDAENKLLHDVAVALNQAHQIAARCANRINGLTGGIQYQPGKVATGAANAYWSTDPSNLSWAPPVKKDNPWWKDGLNGVAGFGKGVVVDGAWGMIKGVGTMAGFGPKGWDWHNVWNSYKAIETLGLPLIFPPASALPFVHKAQVNAVKDFVAADEWKKDKGRAAGKVAFNVITLGIPETRLGMAGKAGDAALAVTRGANKVDVVGHGLSTGVRFGSKGAQVGLDAVKNLRLGEGLGRLKNIHVQGMESLHDPAPKVDPAHFDLHDPKVSAIHEPTAVHEAPPTKPTVRQVADHVGSKHGTDVHRVDPPKHEPATVGGGHPGEGHSSHPAHAPAAHPGGSASDVPTAADPAAHPHGPVHGGGHTPAPGTIHGSPGGAHDPAAGAHTPLTPEEEMRAAHSKVAKGTVPFRDDADAARYGAEHWNDYVNQLSDSEKHAFYEYTKEPPYNGPTYQEINSYLRHGGTPAPGVEHDIAEIDKAMRGNPVPEDIVVSRGTDLGHISVPPPSMEGKVFTDHAYMSTSLGGPAAAFKWKEAILHLRVPKGTPAIYLEKVSAYQAGERELLLGRGVNYRVDRVVFDDVSDQWQIYGEVLPK